MSETDPTGVPAGGSDLSSNGSPTANDGTAGRDTVAGDAGVVEDGSYIDSELENDVAAPDSDAEGEYTDSDLT